MIVDCDMRKWGDRAHWRFDTKLLGHDRHGVWLGARPPTLYSGPQGAGRWMHGFVVLVPRHEWWIASFNDVTLPDPEVYVDVTTGTRWPSETHITAVDLDLDVVRHRDGSVTLLDEDEFEQHRVLYAYPGDLVDRALASAEWLLDAVAARREPFDHTAERWLEQLARAGPA